MSATPRLVFICGGCQEQHDDEDSALECCQPEVYSFWVCPVCGDEHEEEKEARDCCAEELERRGPYWCDPLELEKHGQQRLF